MMAGFQVLYRRTPPPPGQTALAAVLHPWERQLTRERLSRWLLRGATASLVLAILVLLVGWFTLVPESDLRPWALELAPIPLVLAAAIALWPRAHVHRAAELDTRLRLGDRVATAWAFRAVENPIVHLQRHDAVTRLGNQEPAKLGWRPARFELASLGGAFLFAALLLVTPSPQQAVLDRQAADQAAVEQAAQRLDSLRAAAIASPNLTPDQARQLDELLQQAQAELSHTHSQEDASAVLSRAQDQVSQQLGDPNADLRDEALAAMSETLAAEPRTQALADALQQENPVAASQALDDLAAQADQLSDVERQSLSRALQRAANVGRADARTASSLHDAAQALANGASPDTALSQANAAMRDSIQASHSQADVNATLRQLRDLQGRLASGQPLPDSSDQSSAQQAFGTAGSADSAEGTPVALDAGGSRTVADPTNGQNGGGGAGTDSATGQYAGQSAPPNAQAAENVYVPGRPSTGAADQQDMVDQPFTVRGAPRPYRDVLQQYAQTSRDYVDRPDISPAVRDLVKQYFQELEQGQ
ncbi:MAG: hypothetical protein JO020_27560 [Chloroflexi bacterium]|nr:hypothetical protein [Chloroflexota bacterium]